MEGGEYCVICKMIQMIGWMFTTPIEVEGENDDGYWSTFTTSAIIGEQLVCSLYLDSTIPNSQQKSFFHINF